MWAKAGSDPGRVAGLDTNVSNCYFQITKERSVLWQDGKTLEFHLLKVPRCLLTLARRCTPGSKCTASCMSSVEAAACGDVIMILHRFSVIHVRRAGCVAVMSKSSRCRHISAKTPHRQLPVPTTRPAHPNWRRGWRAGDLLKKTDDCNITQASREPSKPSEHKSLFSEST